MSRPLLVILIGSAVLSLLPAFCSNATPEIVLIFPDNFRGTAKLRAGQPNGLKFDRAQSEIELRFPPSGILDLQDHLPTLDWHRLSAKYESGEKLPIDQPENKVSDSQVALRSAGVIGDKEDWYVVGTYDDLKSAMEQKRGFKLPPKK
jgi:hypothetical protein